VHLADVGGRPWRAAPCGGHWERGDAAGAVGAELAIILGADFALENFLDIAAGADPVAAELGQAGHDVDAGGAVGVGAGRVVDAQGGLVARGVEHDLAHGDAERADVDLAAAADRAGGDARGARVGQFGAGRNVGHGHALLKGE
jgi:hypothetical protein